MRMHCELVLLISCQRGNKVAVWFRGLLCICIYLLRDVNYHGTCAYDLCFTTFVCINVS